MNNSMMSETVYEHILFHIVRPGWAVFITSQIVQAKQIWSKE